MVPLRKATEPTYSTIHPLATDNLRRVAPPRPTLETSEEHETTLEKGEEDETTLEQGEEDETTLEKGEEDETTLKACEDPT